MIMWQNEETALKTIQKAGNFHRHLESSVLLLYIKFPIVPSVHAWIWVPKFVHFFLSYCYALHFIMKCRNFKIGPEASKFTPEQVDKDFSSLNTHFLNSSSASKKLRSTYRPGGFDLSYFLVFHLIPKTQHPSHEMQLPHVGLQFQTLGCCV